jgi:3-oxoadipate enol-lactonase
MRLEINNHQLSCQLSGREAEDAETVCLSHSLACSSVMWEPQLRALNPRFRVLRYDTRGHGGSEATPPPYTLDQLADDAVALLDALGIERAHWVGLSMGGMIGQNLGLRHPRRLLSLLLCDTLSVVSDEAQPMWADRIETARREGMAPLCEPTLARWFTPAFIENDPPSLKAIRKQILNTPVAGYVGCCEAIRRINYVDRLDSISLPTRVIVGANDPATPPADAAVIHRGIRGSSLVTIDEAAHLSNVEQPEVFNDAVLEFLHSQ